MKAWLLSSLTALGILAADPVLAEVQPVNIWLHDASNSYSVPDDKVLVIEHFLWVLEGDATQKAIYIRAADRPNGVGDAFLDFSTEDPDMWSPVQPIRVVGGGGAEVRISHYNGTDWHDLIIVGLLVDPEDLFAGISSELDKSRVEGGHLVAAARFASPRPRRVTVKSSTDLPTGFAVDPEGRVTETTDPKVATVSVPADSDKAFMQLETVAIPGLD